MLEQNVCLSEHNLTMALSASCWCWDPLDQAKDCKGQSGSPLASIVLARQISKFGICGGTWRHVAVRYWQHFDRIWKPKRSPPYSQGVSQGAGLHANDRIPDPPRTCDRMTKWADDWSSRCIVWPDLSPIHISPPSSNASLSLDNKAK